MREQNSSKGLSFLSVLTLIFVIAKILGFVSWSWWLVFSPLWISAIAGVIVIGVMLFIEYKDRNK